MPAKKVLRLGGDVREHPRYSIEEAADYLHVPPSTMKAWMRGQRYRTNGRLRIFLPVIQPADPKNKLLSFYNLAEAHTDATQLIRVPNNLRSFTSVSPQQKKRTQFTRLGPSLRYRRGSQAK